MKTWILVGLIFKYTLTLVTACGFVFRMLFRMLFMSLRFFFFISLKTTITIQYVKWKSEDIQQLMRVFHTYLCMVYLFTVILKGRNDKTFSNEKK